MKHSQFSGLVCRECRLQGLIDLQRYSPRQVLGAIVAIKKPTVGPDSIFEDGSVDVAERSSLSLNHEIIVVLHECSVRRRVPLVVRKAFKPVGCIDGFSL